MERSPEEQMKEKLDGHLGFSIMDALHGGSYKGGSLVKHSPGDKNITSRHKMPGKNIIEHNCIKKRKEDVQHVLVDVMVMRQMELLDPEQMPMSKLVDSVIKVLPTKIEAESHHTFTFADMIQTAAKKVDLEDVEDVEPLEGMDE